LLVELAKARQAGARIMLRFVGGERFYRNNDHSFSLTKWKQRLDRWRNIDFSSYIEDGTVMGHFILDEPHDKTNWGGNYVSHADLDEMARYSKQIWPTLPTVVRGWPSYLRGYQFKHLDAAWAQYSARFGPIDEFVRNNVRDAKASGLALVAGLNLLDGGNRESGITGHNPSKFAMSASQVRSWGGALLAEPYICAFISWKYKASYFGRNDITSALTELSKKARDFPKKTCRA
jgi:hypothetical protein